MRAMKDSGVEWIGEIPEGWTQSKGKYVATINPVCDQKLDGNDVVGYLPMECLKSGAMYPRSIKYGNITSGLTYFENNDVVMAKVTPCFENGNIAIAEGLAGSVGFGSSELVVYRCHGMHARYLFYCLQCDTWKSEGIGTMTGTGGLKRISPYFVRNSRLPFPESSIQIKIITFLDKKCSQIDAIIARQQEVIEKLKEYKQSVITEAVTKGLDPTVPMKDSGIEWIGQIPSTWEMHKICWDYSVELGKMLDAKRITGESLHPYLRNADIQWDGIAHDNLPAMDFLDNELTRYSVCPGDLLVCEGGEIGKSAIVPDDFPDGICYQKALHRVRKRNEKSDVRFLYYILFCMAKLNSFNISAEKATIAHLPAVVLNAQRIPAPIIEEQRLISKYLDKKCAQINGVIDAKRSVITRLTAYKKSLIYEAVTGKLEV